MKVKYDKEQDILYLSFRDEAVYESDEEKKISFWTIPLLDR